MRYSQIFEYNLSDWDLIDNVFSELQKSGINARFDYPRSKHKDRQERIPRIRHYYWNGTFVSLFIQPGRVWVGTFTHPDLSDQELLEKSNALFDELRKVGLNPVKNRENQNKLPYSREPVIKFNKNAPISEYVEIVKKVVTALENIKPILSIPKSGRNLSPNQIQDTLKHVKNWLRNNLDKHNIRKHDEAMELTKKVVDEINTHHGGMVPSEQDIWNLIPKFL